jgi:hypothetical protein
MDAGGQLQRLAFVLDPAGDHREDVAAQPAEDVGLAHRADQSLGDRAQHPIGLLGAEGLVDDVEVVEPGAEDGDVLARRQVMDEVFAGGDQQFAVGQPGEPVVEAGRGGSAPPAR